MEKVQDLVEQRDYALTKYKVYTTQNDRLSLAHR
jgi:hypothetical protein